MRKTVPLLLLLACTACAQPVPMSPEAAALQAKRQEIRREIIRRNNLTPATCVGGMECKQVNYCDGLASDVAINASPAGHSLGYLMFGTELPAYRRLFISCMSSIRRTNEYLFSRAD